MHSNDTGAVSVCVATYNGGKYLAEQLDSIICQLQYPDEVLIADDGSTDNTLEIISSYSKFVRLVATGKSGGVVNNFERCLSHAKNDIIVLADQDDVWLPNRVVLIKEKMQECDFLVLNGMLVDQDLVSMNTTVFDSVGISEGFLANLAKNTFVGCCTAFKAPLLKMALPFPKDLPWHDWYLGLLAELTVNIQRLPEVTIYFRRHGANASNTGGKSRHSLFKKIKMRCLVAVSTIYVAFIRRYMRHGN